MSLHADLLKVIACTKCKGEVKQQEMFFTCVACSIAYPILEHTVPNMLLDESWELEKAKKANFAHSEKL